MYVKFMLYKFFNVYFLSKYFRQLQVQKSLLLKHLFVYKCKYWVINNFFFNRLQDKIVNSSEYKLILNLIKNKQTIGIFI